MNRTYWTTVALIGLLIGTALFAQSIRNRGLEHQLAIARPIAGEQSGSAIDSNANQVINVHDAVDDAPQSEQAAEEIAALVANLGDMRRDPSGLIRLLPKLLPIVDSLSAGEMIEVARSLDSSEQADGTSAARMILLLLAAEDDPERILKDDALLKDPGVLQGVMGALARRNPHKARKWLEKLSLPESARQRLDQVVFLQTLRSDVPSGIAYLRENREIVNNSPHLFAPESLATQLMTASDLPENADIRRELVALVLRSADAKGGVNATRKEAERFRVASEDLVNFFQSSYRKSGSEDLLTWMSDSLSMSDQLKVIPNALGRWASQDYNAAGKWLGEMAASSAKDEAIRSYAHAVIDLDPEAAMVWATEIQNEEMRKGAAAYLLERWSEADPAAAEAYLDRDR